MARKITVLLLLFIGISSTALAQFYSTQYRPPKQNWQYLQTPHFKLIYSKGNDSTALQMGQILEEQYPLVQNVVGGQLKNFPIVLNDYNDRSNGFVTTINFRSEIELPPLKGKSLNPQTGNWMQIVGPHELVHAMQFSNLGDYNIPRLVSLFSPDLARSFHTALPPGAIEGIAVHHETKNVSSNGGRGNHPIFTNQFDAVFESNRRWSMGQMMQPPGYTRPFSRYYIGGQQFTAWLQNEFGPQTTQQAFDFYMDFPFLGYGIALRHATGQWPGQLYDQFENAKTSSLENQSKVSQEFTTLNIPLKGREIRRPKWLSDSTIMFYGLFYNGRPGFYKYNLETNNLERLITTNIVGDYRYDLSRDRSQMVYSYYEENAIYDNTAKAELVAYNFTTEASRQLTQDGRLYAPLFTGDSLLALRSRPVSSQLVSVSASKNPSAAINEIASLGDHNIVAVDAHPLTSELAVVVNKGGMQALWITDPDNLSDALQSAPDIAFSGGSIFDPEWHPTKQKLMFSSGFSGTQQLYEYDLDANSINQITGGSNNSFEGNYSPDGNRIVYIRQVKNERLPAIVERSNFLNIAVDGQTWQPTTSKITLMKRPVVSDSIGVQSQNWKTGRYNTGASWLKPRTVLPVFEEVSGQNSYKAGFSIHSSNTLADQSYSAAFSYFEERGWYDLTYQNKTFYPGFKTRIFSEPSYRFADNIGIFLRQERGLALSVPLDVRLNQNVYNTSFFMEPEIRRSQIRYFELDGNATSNFADISIANVYGQFNYRLQQNTRDAQPNSGIYLFSEVEYFGGGDDLNFNVSGNQLNVSTSNEMGFRGGIFGFISPLRRWNQSLRIGIEGLTQSAPIFDTQSLPSEAFSGSVFPLSNNLLSFNTRYTIPLAHVDNGGLLIPFYLSKIYMVLFTDTIMDPGLADWTSRGSSVFGLGVRTQFRFANLSFDIGIGFGYEPTGETQFFIGDF